MTFTKLTLAALALGAALTPALADSGSSQDDRLAALAQSRGLPHTAMIEGRQAAPIAATGSAVDRYLEQRNAGESN